MCPVKCHNHLNWPFDEEEQQLHSELHLDDGACNPVSKGEPGRHIKWAHFSRLYPGFLSKQLVRRWTGNSRALHLGSAPLLPGQTKVTSALLWTNPDLSILCINVQCLESWTRLVDTWTPPLECRTHPWPGGNVQLFPSWERWPQTKRSWLPSWLLHVWCVEGHCFWIYCVRECVCVLDAVCYCRSFVYFTAKLSLLGQNAMFSSSTTFDYIRLYKGFRVSIE